MFRRLVLSVLLVACNQGNASRDTASSSTVTAVTSAPVVASSAPPAIVTAVVSAVVTASAPVASASAAVDESGPPPWLRLGPGEKLKARNKTGGCVTITTKNGDEGRCEPMAAPAANVDDVTLPSGRDCPVGFAPSGSRYCSRACKSNVECHGKHTCQGGQCVD